MVLSFESLPRSRYMPITSSAIPIDRAWKDIDRGAGGVAARAIPGEESRTDYDKNEEGEKQPRRPSGARRQGSLSVDAAHFLSPEAVVSIGPAL